MEIFKNFLINLKNIGTANKLIKKSADQELEIQKLNKKILEYEKMISVVSHDLRSPVSGFLGLTELLVSEHELSAIELKEYHELMHNQTKNIYTLLNNLLNWAKNRFGGYVHPINLNLRDAIENVITSVKNEARKKDILIANEVTENLFVYSDSDILEIVLRNLISNAIKFSNPGSVIDISAPSSGEFVSVYVTDSGVGIEPENMDKLFGYDFMTTRGTSNEKGTGLGLLLCKELIEEQGGKISAFSIPGQGTTISFTLKKVKH